MLLRAFLEKEFEFRDRAKTRLFAAEDQAQLRWEFQEQGLEFAIRGKADRIDECLSSSQNGLWVIDYKSGRQDLRGVDIREKGYRLQLAFYAVAAQAQLQRPVLGVQLVELTREARRSVGLFPKALNGKQPGSLTQVRSNNPSLFEGEPSELWTELEQKIRNTAFDFSSGKGDALPVMGERECDRCRAREVCGQSRREWVEGQA
jgi:RecB family exonuclease